MRRLTCGKFMPQIDSTFITIAGTIFLVLILALRISKAVQVKTFRMSKPFIKKFANPDEAIKEIEALEDQAKQSGANPDEVKILTDVEDMIKESQKSGKKINIVINKNIRFGARFDKDLPKF